MLNRIDLHTHTSASDGIYSPVDLIDLAIRDGLLALAITDHDCIDGLSQAVQYAKKKEFKLIPGIEFSVEYSKGSLHIVGLYIDYNNAELIETTENLKKLRASRADKIIEELEKCNIHIPLDEVLALANGAPLGKPHFARIMIKYGYANSLKEVFRNYLVDGKPGDIPKKKISPDDAIKLIKRSGGISIIAHPISLEFGSFEEFELILQGLIHSGLQGIEVYAAMHSSEQADGFLKIADKYRLLVTGGSDFHGDRNEVLGTYADGKIIPVEILKQLENYKKEL